MKEEYPETMQEFAGKFRSEADCYEYLVKVRWKVLLCPYCKHDKLWKYNIGKVYRCNNCKKDVRVTAGTVFHGSHLPLLTWFYALWLMVSQKQGVSALGMSRSLGIKRQKTGWELLSTIRSSMSQKGKEKLSGLVEVDETFVGGIHKGKRGRGALGKALVLVAVEDKGKPKIGRIRMQIIEDATSINVLKSIEDMIEKGSAIRTDELKSYEMLVKHDYKHVVIKKDLSKEIDSTPPVHRMASLLKRWILGTHQGGIHLENLQSYLDEFVFIFNRRTSTSRGKLFYRLIQGMLGVKDR